MTPESTDQVLLGRFAREADETAFAKLVQRHLALVFGTATRVLGNHAAAPDVTQAVFVALAREARALQRHPALAGWLHQTAVNRARAHLRAEARRRQREENATRLATLMDANDPGELLPLLDDTLLELNASDRQALFLRYFEDKSLREVGLVLGIREDAAQKRVAKALQELTKRLRRRGVAVAAPTVTLLALQRAAALGLNSPAGLSALVTNAALTASLVPLGGGAAWLAKFMALTKTQTAVACAVLVALPATLPWMARHRIETEISALAATLADVQAAQEDAALANANLQERARMAEMPPQVTPRPASTQAEPVRWYAWDEASDYVRLPRAAVSKYSFGEFENISRAWGPQRVPKEPLNRDGRPSPVLLDALGLTESERAQVSTALLNAGSAVQQLIAQHSSLTTDTTPEGRESARLRVVGAPAEAMELERNLTDSLMALMGGDRTAMLYEQGREVFHQTWTSFGSRGCDLTLTQKEDGTVQVKNILYDASGNAVVTSWVGPEDVLMPPPLQPFVDRWTHSIKQPTSSEQP